MKSYFQKEVLQDTANVALMSEQMHSRLLVHQPELLKGKTTGKRESRNFTVTSENPLSVL